MLAGVVSAHAHAPADDPRAGEVESALSELLQLRDVRVPTDGFILKDEEIAPGQDAASRFFHATYRSARNSQSRTPPGPADWKPRERALLSACMSAQAGAVVATRKVVQGVGIPVSLWSEEVRRLNVFLSGSLSEPTAHAIDANDMPQGSSHTHGMFTTEREFEAERDIDISPWFDRDIAFLALAAASAFAADAMGQPVTIDNLLDKHGRDEAFREWSQRQCSRLMFLRSAYVDYLDLDAQGVKEKETPSSQKVQGDLVLRNIGARRLVGSTQVILLSDTPEEHSYDPRVQQIHRIDFDLAPLASSTERIDLEFRKHGQRIPRYIWGPASAPTVAEPKGEAMNIGTCTERATAAPNAAPLVGALAKYGADSPSGFANSMASPLDPIARRAPGIIPVPGAQSTLVQDLIKWRTVEALLYAGGSEAEARAVFNSAMNAFRSFCGDSGGKLDDAASPNGTMGSYSINMF